MLDHLRWTTAMFDIHKMCSNPTQPLRMQERQGILGIHTLHPHPFQIMSFTFITSEGSPFLPLLSPSYFKNLTTT